MSGMQTNNKRKEEWIRSPWTISIGTAVFSLLLTIVYDFSKQEPILTTIWKITKWTESFILIVLNFDLRLWWVLLGIVFLTLLLYILAKIKNTENFKPDFCKYREDKFKNWTWTWDWEFNKRKEAWVVSKMQAHCPRCETSLIDLSNEYEAFFECPRCDFQAKNNYCDDPFKIETLILDNLDRKKRKGKYKNTP